NIYSNAYDMDIMCVRAFNHTGPGQAPLFVVSDFCRQAAEIELGKKENTIYVGNLSAKRDFTDVRDVVRAYELLMQKGKKGETYNVGSGEAMEINEILKKIVALSGAEINVKVDESRLRPIDVPIIEADISKLKETTGWERKFDIDTTIEDMLEYWRNELR
ncbi:MAG: GDP-mannose 4,6-dehydratase, partial [Firmicutes bacterium]|nr:GDP-mannose 4,6-dehydratase [Bacillota bacterium]